MFKINLKAFFDIRYMLPIGIGFIVCAVLLLIPIIKGIVSLIFTLSFIGAWFMGIIITCGLIGKLIINLFYGDITLDNIVFLEHKE